MVLRCEAAVLHKMKGIVIVEEREIGNCWICGAPYPEGKRSEPCPNCGNAPLRGRCEHCGEVVYSSDLHCPKCGYPRECWRSEDDLVCFNCGTPVILGERYCRCCGRRAAEVVLPAHERREIMMTPCVYGPKPSDRLNIVDLII